MSKKIKSGSRVRITQGPLAGQLGTVVSVRVTNGTMRTNVMIDGEHGVSRKFIGDSMIGLA